MVKRKALGSGLEALLTKKPAQKTVEAMPSSETDIDSQICSIPVVKISRNINQPRKYFSQTDLESMAQSIKELGQFTPIIVRKTSDDTYELVAGERRWRAIQLLQHDNIDAVVMDIDEKDSAMIALVENIQREQLSAVEESDGLIKLNQTYSMTHEEIAKYTGKSRSHVTNLIRLSELSKYCREMLMSKRIDMGHARAVLALGHTDQDKLIREAIAKKLSVRSVEAAVNKRGSKPKNTQRQDNDTIRLKNELSEILGAEVSINHNQSGKGKITISYKSLNELDGIISKIK